MGSPPTGRFLLSGTVIGTFIGLESYTWTVILYRCKVFCFLKNIACWRTNSLAGLLLADLSRSLFLIMDYST